MDPRNNRHPPDVTDLQRAKRSGSATATNESRSRSRNEEVRAFDATTPKAHTHFSPSTPQTQQPSRLAEGDTTNLETNTSGLYVREPEPVESPISRLLRFIRTRDAAGKLEAQRDLEISRELSVLNNRTRVLASIGNKGGPGKSTVAATAAIALSEHDRARVVVLEANPDWGTLRDLLGMDVNPLTITDVLRDYDLIERGGYGVLQRYLTVYGRMAALTAPEDPDEMHMLTPSDYDRVLSLLSKHASIVILDCGTSFVNRISQWAIQVSDGIVLTATEDAPTLRKALKAVRYLVSTRYERAYGDIMADLTVLGSRRQLERLEMRHITLAANQIGRPGDMPVDWSVIERELPEVPVVKLPYNPQIPNLLNTGRLTMDNMPAPYRRSLKQLLATSLGRMAEQNGRTQ